MYIVAYDFNTQRVMSPMEYPCPTAGVDDPSARPLASNYIKSVIVGTSKGFVVTATANNQLQAFNLATHECRIALNVTKDLSTQISAMAWNAGLLQLIGVMSDYGAKQYSIFTVNFLPYMNKPTISSSPKRQGALDCYGGVIVTS